MSRIVVTPSILKCLVAASARRMVPITVAERVRGSEMASSVSDIATSERYAKRILCARNSGQIIGEVIERAEGI